jgi:hypothetical protein
MRASLEQWARHRDRFYYIKGIRFTKIKQNELPKTLSFPSEGFTRGLYQKKSIYTKVG